MFNTHIGEAEYHTAETAGLSLKLSWERFVMFLPHDQESSLFSRKWTNRDGRSKAGGFRGPIEGLPELMAACSGKQAVFTDILGQEFQSSQVGQVRLQIDERRLTERT